MQEFFVFLSPKMKSLFFGFLLTIVSSVGLISAATGSDCLDDLSRDFIVFYKTWKEFKLKYGKIYESAKEENKRKQIFWENLQTILTHNLLAAKNLRSFTVGINQFTDLLVSEYSELVNGFKEFNKRSSKAPITLRNSSAITIPAATFTTVTPRSTTYTTATTPQSTTYLRLQRLRSLHSTTYTTATPQSTTFSTMTLSSATFTKARKLPKTTISYPDSVDWRKLGYVTPVKNQGRCACCWAFSSTGSLEGQHFRKTGTLVSLSEQNILDCAERPKYDDNGCKSGIMTYAFEYVDANKGIDTEASYPYVAKVGASCLFNSSNVGATMKSFVTVASGDEVALMQAVATVGPVSVTVDDTHTSFQTYRSGIYDEPNCTTNVTHAMLAVGYGTQNGTDYWIIKNSWGTTWGDKGYIRMSRNKGNQCGIATYALYPTL